MINQCKNAQALEFGMADPEIFRVCAFLVNVLSHMYDQWNAEGCPPEHTFIWVPKNKCSVINDFNVADYEFGEVIWSTFTLKQSDGTKKTFTEPFGSFVQSKIDRKYYLVFRGSKSPQDFHVDVEGVLVRYDPPIQNEVRHIYVENGFYLAYQGMRNSLRKKLKIHAVGQKVITVTGHSLGSALATLTVPDALADGLRVINYNSASPMVGDESFKSYYESLNQTGPGGLGAVETFRLVNKSDIVPTLPPLPDYRHVGSAVTFNADYIQGIIRDIEKNHDPCTCYAYAIFNPQNPCNPQYGNRKPFKIVEGL